MNGTTKIRALLTFGNPYKWKTKMQNKETRALLLKVKIFLLCSLIIIGCDSPEKRQLIEEGTLVQAVQAKKIIPVIDLVHKRQGVICILHPYQDFVFDNASKSSEINAHLKMIEYKAEEYKWALVVADDSKVEVSVFRVSRSLNPYVRSKNINLPEDFFRADCAEVERAYLFRFSENEVNYLVLGER